MANGFARYGYPAQALGGVASIASPIYNFLMEGMRRKAMGAGLLAAPSPGFRGRGATARWGAPEEQRPGLETDLPTKDDLEARKLGGLDPLLQSTRTVPPEEKGRRPVMPPYAGLPGEEGIEQALAYRRAPLRFAWGGGTPQDYVPGETDIMSLPGEPAGGRAGFMQPTAMEYYEAARPGTLALSGRGRPTSPSRSGGFVTGAPEMMDPRTALELADTATLRRQAEDPLWRQREESLIRQQEEESIKESMLRLEREQMKEIADDIDATYRELLAQWMEENEGQTPDQTVIGNLWDEATRTVTGTLPQLGR